MGSRDAVPVVMDGCACCLQAKQDATEEIAKVKSIDTEIKAKQVSPRPGWLRALCSCALHECPLRLGCVVRSASAASARFVLAQCAPVFMLHQPVLLQPLLLLPPLR